MAISGEYVHAVLVPTIKQHFCNCNHHPTWQQIGTTKFANRNRGITEVETLNVPENPLKIPASSKGCCLNPKGWCIGTPYHPFVFCPQRIPNRLLLPLIFLGARMLLVSRRVFDGGFMISCILQGLLWVA